MQTALAESLQQRRRSSLAAGGAPAGDADGFDPFGGVVLRALAKHERTQLRQRRELGCCRGQEGGGGGYDGAP